jgi:hypothetical protein
VAETFRHGYQVAAEDNVDKTNVSAGKKACANARAGTALDKDLEELAHEFLDRQLDRKDGDQGWRGRERERDDRRPA